MSFFSPYLPIIPLYLWPNLIKNSERQMFKLCLGLKPNLPIRQFLE